MTPMTWVYISGPITGVADYQKIFTRAARRLRSAGLHPVNPAFLGGPPGQTWEAYMRRDIKLLADCDGVALLPGWEASRGALLEHHIATQLRLDIRPLHDWTTTSKETTA